MRPGSKTVTPLRELTLDEMLADPIVHLVMRRDGVQEHHVRSLMARVREQSSVGPARRTPGLWSGVQGGC